MKTVTYDMGRKVKPVVKPQRLARNSQQKSKLHALLLSQFSDVSSRLCMHKP